MKQDTQTRHYGGDMEYEVRISSCKYPRKAEEFAVWVVPVNTPEGSFTGGICVYPFTPSRALANLQKQAFDALLSDPAGLGAIYFAKTELP
jgi:hypothetical protein